MGKKRIGTNEVKIKSNGLIIKANFLERKFLKTSKSLTQLVLKISKYKRRNSNYFWYQMFSCILTIHAPANKLIAENVAKKLIVKFHLQT